MRHFGWVLTDKVLRDMGYRSDSTAVLQDIMGPLRVVPPHHPKEGVASHRACDRLETTHYNFVKLASL